MFNHPVYLLRYTRRVLLRRLLLLFRGRHARLLDRLFLRLFAQKATRAATVVLLGPRSQVSSTLQVKDSLYNIIILYSATQ